MQKVKIMTGAMMSIMSLFVILSCQGQSQQTDKNKTPGSVNKSMYENMKKTVMADDDAAYNDSTNVFDNDSYDPTADTVDRLLYTLGNVYVQDSNMIVKFDQRTPEQLKGQQPEDTLIIGKETYTRDLRNITESEIQALDYNLAMVKSTRSNDTLNGACRGPKCPVYAHVSKGKQRLYLYINGDLIDSFKTSTGDAKHTTPDFNKKPDGRMFKKYSSHKYPGGNYNGLGNMPYAVFIQGGFAIHGATTGEIARLGTPASHGCVRIHPKNARIFFELVNYAGPQNTWITVENN